MEERQSEIRSLEMKLKAVSTKVDTASTKVDKVVEELKEVRAEIKSIKKGHAQEWMDGQEVTLALHISQRTLQTLRCSGQLPFSKPHKKLYYKASDVKAMLERNYSTPTIKQKNDD